MGHPSRANDRGYGILFAASVSSLMLATFSGPYGTELEIEWGVASWRNLWFPPGLQPPFATRQPRSFNAIGGAQLIDRLG
jgi:hypothetical protein